MKIGYKGNITKKGKINYLVDYLEKPPKNSWVYMEIKVELEPTVDFTNQNVLVRWLDLNEGFIDKIIVHSLQEFQNLFNNDKTLF